LVKIYIFSQKFDLSEYALHINFLGCPEDRNTFTKKLHTFLSNHESAICDTCKKRKEANILRVFDCKNEDCHKVYVDAPRLTDELCELCAVDWSEVQDRLEELSVSFVHNTKLVRGLDYYNKTIFEFVSPLLGAQSAFCAGGRYDSLVTMLGGKQDQPSIGAAIGVDRLEILLQETNSPLLEQQLAPLYDIVPLEKDQHPVALKLGQNLLNQSFCVDILFDGSLKSMMRKANKMGAEAVLLLGPDEQSHGTVTFKDMQSGESKTVKQIDVVGLLKK